MADFNKIVKKVFNIEGGYQNHPSDYGNKTTSAYGCEVEYIGTNHGIGAATLQEYLKGCPTVDMMKNLTREQAKIIYKKLFWDKVMGDYIEDQYVALNVFDCYVNQMRIVKYVVRNALKKCGITISLPPIPFNISVVNAINRADAKTLFGYINEERKAYYTKTAAAQNRVDQYGNVKVPNSWIERCSLDYDTGGSFWGFTSPGNQFLNACESDPTDEEMAIMEAANSTLAVDLKKMKNMKYGWWANNKYAVLTPASLLFLGLSVYFYVKEK